jgi:hypothetical protein
MNMPKRMSCQRLRAAGSGFKQGSALFGSAPCAVETKASKRGKAKTLWKIRAFIGGILLT